MSQIYDRLSDFAKEHRFSNKDGTFSKGALCVALVVTRHAMDKGLPLDHAQLLTDGGGQVLGLGKANVQLILQAHGISKVLAEEGGRTSRGSIGNMRAYVKFLNDLTPATEVTLSEIESWWIGRVRLYFTDRPLVLRLDAGKSLGVMIADLLAQADKRQRDRSGVMYVGALLQHLVGAKLDLIHGGIEHHGASVADTSSGRMSDFVVGDVAIHVTCAPSESLIRKCNENLGYGHRPMIITPGDSVELARGLAKQAGLLDRVEIIEAEQFLAVSFYEHGEFRFSGSCEFAIQLVDRYNEIVGRHETDPGLRIEASNKHP
jgi:hypothetical protein